VFGQIGGLPVHALVLHAAVLLAPLAAVVAMATLVSRWRTALRWPLVALAAAAAATVFVAMQSGEVLKSAMGDQLAGNVTGALVERHQVLGGRLLIALLALLVVAVGAALVHNRTGAGRIGAAGSVLATVVAVGVLVLTYQTGEAGAKARWNPDGSFDYSGTQASS